MAPSLRTQAPHSVPSDADRLRRGLPLESGDAPSPPPPRALH